MRRLVPALGGAVGVATWVAFLLWYDSGGWMSESLLPEAAMCAAAGGVLLGSGAWYSKLNGSRAGYGAAAVLLFGMAGYTFTRTGVVGVGVLTVAAIATAISALRGFDRKPLPATDAPVQREAPDRTTRLLWVAAALCVPSAFLISSLLGAGPGSGVLHVSEDVRLSFNLLGVMLAPVVVVLVLTHAFLCWFASNRLASHRGRTAAILSITAAAGLIALPFGLMPPAPFTVLTYLLPLFATCTYVLLFPTARMTRVLGVAALAAAIGLSLYVLVWALVGGETD